MSAKIRTIDDLKLTEPQATSLKEKIIYAVIFEKDKSELLKDIEYLKKEQQIDALDYYQYKNFLTNDGPYKAEYYIDNDLRVLKELLINMNDKRLFDAKLKDHLNQKYVYNFIIYRMFNYEDKNLDKYLIQLHKSENQKILFIKSNYRNNNLIYLERALVSLNEEEQIIVYDLLIPQYIEGSKYKASKFIEKRQKLEYDLSYSYDLVSIYRELNETDELDRELKTILTKKHDYKLLEQLLELHKNKIVEDDFAEYAKYAKEENLDRLRLDFMDILYPRNLVFKKLLDECGDSEDPRKIYYQAIDFCQNDEFRKAYLLIIAEKEKVGGDKKIGLLESQLKVILNIEIKDPQNKYYKTSQEITHRQYIKSENRTDYPFSDILNKASLKLLDFYKAYGALDVNNNKSLLECYLVYKNIEVKLEGPEKDKIKEKMEALGFE